MDAPNKLSTKEYWDEVLKKADLPRINSYKSYNYRVTMNFMKKFLSNSSGKSMLEIGCGSSGWLPYFKKEYDLVISGLDYSEVGCEIARKNLQMQDLPFDEIYCRDFLDKDFTLPKKFDFIFSYGVVEHFDDTAAVVAIYKKLLAPGGVMITLVPNLKGFNGFITRRFMTDIYKLHNAMSNQQLKQYHSVNSLKIIKSAYAGTFSLAVLPFANANVWLFKAGTKRRSGALKVISIVDNLISKFLKLTHFNLPTRLFSPYIICVARNEDRS